MIHRFKSSRSLKWSGLLVAALLGLAWVASLRWAFDARVTGSFVVCVVNGIFYVVFHEPGEFMMPPGDKLPAGPRQGFWLRLSRHYVPRSSEFPYLSNMTRGPLCALGVPFGLPLLLVAIPTIVLFLLDRRPLPGHCRTCGYDLTGNVSGRCPECGEPV